MQKISIQEYQGWIAYFELVEENERLEGELEEKETETEELRKLELEHEKLQIEHSRSETDIKRLNDDLNGELEEKEHLKQELKETQEEYEDIYHKFEELKWLFKEEYPIIRNIVDTLWDVNRNFWYENQLDDEPDKDTYFKTICDTFEKFKNLKIEF